MSNDPSATAGAAPLPPPPTIHEAERAPGASGAILRGPEIDFAAAVARRRAGKDVVVCGDDIDRNRRQALAIESAVGPCQRADPHLRHAGPLALPHYEPDPKARSGHTFYETGRRKTRRKP
jgi:hypothetical protein